MVKGFRDFLMRGNVIDLAVAVIIGAAFTAIVNSFVADLLNPMISATVGKPDFSYLVMHVNGGVIKIGNFLNAVISFILVAGVVYFAIVAPMNKLMARVHPAAPAVPVTKPCPECLSEIPIAARRCSHCGQPVA